MKASLNLIDPTQQRPSSFSRLLNNAAVWGSGILLDLLVFIKAIILSKVKDHYVGNINFHNNGIDLSLSSGLSHYSYDSLRKLSIKYYTESFIHRYDYVKHPVISLHTENNNVKEFYYEATNHQLMKVLDILYNNKIPFKEFRNDQRTYRQKKIGFKEIQDFKERYNMEW